MSSANHSRYFSERTKGPMHGLYFLTSPILPKYDVQLSLAAKQSLRDIILDSERGNNRMLSLYHQSKVERARLVTTIAAQLNTTVCHLSCKAFVQEYIGETEKNLSSLLARAENKDWILVFEDADALFMPYSNQEKGQKDLLKQRYLYLMKRLSLYPGLVVLLINTKTCFERVIYQTEHFV